MLVVSKLQHWQNYYIGIYLLYIRTRFIKIYIKWTAQKYVTQ